MAILITGVAGFIGSNLLLTLLNLNQKVVGLDNLSPLFGSLKKYIMFCGIYLSHESISVVSYFVDSNLLAL